MNADLDICPLKGETTEQGVASAIAVAQKHGATATQTEVEGPSGWPVIKVEGSARAVKATLKELGY